MTHARCKLTKPKQWVNEAVFIPQLLLEPGSVTTDTEGMDEPSFYQRWFIPTRPGLRQFALVAIGLIAPLLGVLGGPEMVVPALGLGITLGLGLGIGWAVLYARSWFRQAPATTLAIFASAAACLLHVEVLPRWELLLRVREARTEALHYHLKRSLAAEVPLPSYRIGPGEARMQLGEGQILVWTGLGLRRWTPAGWRDRAWILVTRSGEAHICWSRSDLDQSLHRLSRAPLDQGAEAPDSPAP